MLITGDQEPVMPLIDIVGNADNVVPEQIGAICVKVGVAFGMTVTLKVVPLAHSFAAGVKVYVPDVVLLTTAGFQVPVTPFVDTSGNTGLVAPEHIGAIAVKLGVRIGLTVKFRVVVVAHWFALGVNK